MLNPAHILVVVDHFLAETMPKQGRHRVGLTENDDETTFLNRFLNLADTALQRETVTKAPSFVAIGRDEEAAFFSHFLDLTDAALYAEGSPNLPERKVPRGGWRKARDAKNRRVSQADLESVRTAD